VGVTGASPEGGAARLAVADTLASTRTMSKVRNIRESDGESRATPVYGLSAAESSIETDAVEPDNWT
jgi:hypothetical protein